MKSMQAATTIDPELFRKSCGRFATGIAVATVADADGNPFGLTVNSFTSVSCCPPLVLICVDYRCSLLPLFRSSSWYGINMLTDKQRDLSVRFSQRELDRFEGIEWKRSENGVPLIGSCLASLECCVSQTIEAGDHAILIAEVTSLEWQDGEPLVYFGSSYRHLVPQSLK
jgi:flavin reductase (DIM6/NTAB) family NADH-FMN oxidoreductase RutF